LHARALSPRLAASCAHRAALADHDARPWARCCVSASSACAAAVSRVSGLLCRAISRSPPGARGTFNLPHREGRCAAQQARSKREAAPFRLMSASASCGHTARLARVGNVPRGDLSRCSNVREQGCSYSITSSARCCMNPGTSRPSALAVFRLMTSWNLIAAWTGSSLGFTPLRIRSA